MNTLTQLAKIMLKDNSEVTHSEVTHKKKRGPVELCLLLQMYDWHLVKGYLENNICYFICPISL